MIVLFYSKYLFNFFNESTFSNNRINKRSDIRFIKTFSLYYDRVRHY